VVSPRDTSRISGYAMQTEICMKPTRRAMSASARSCAERYRDELMAQAWMPRANAARSGPRPQRHRARAPLAVRAKTFIDFDDFLIEHRRQFDTPHEELRLLVGVRNESAKPRVVTNTVRSPLRSSRALVATVVPIFTASMASAGMGSRAPRPNNSRMPWMAASS
jgi:hypothetical protein